MKGMKGMGDILAPENGNLRLNWTVRLNPEGRKIENCTAKNILKIFLPLIFVFCRRIFDVDVLLI